MAAERNPPILACAVVALSAATSFALTRVFAGRTWCFALLAAAALAAGVVALGHLRRWATASTIAVLALFGLWWSNLVTRPSESWYLLATPTSARHWIDALGRTGSVLRGAVIPVAPSGAALQLAVVAIFVTAAGSTWSALRADGAISAVIPQLALFIAISALGKHGYLVTTIVWTAALLGFLLVHQAVVGTTHHTEFHVISRQRSRLLSGGAVGGVLALVAGAAIGPRIPSASSAPLLNYRHLGRSQNGSGSITAVSPLVNIRDQLNLSDPIELFTVRAERPARWRLTALDAYDGDLWKLADGTHTSQTFDAVRPSAGGVVPLDQQYTLGQYSTKFLPAAYQSRSTDGVRGLSVIAASSSLLVPDDNHSGLQYSVHSELTDATPSDLRLAPPLDGTDPVARHNLTLPPVSQRIRDLATQITAGEPTEYDKALALQQYFRSEFAYDTSIDLSESDNAMESFLTHRRGFCEQFSVTYTVMARSVGIPTRVATGFQPGHLGTDGLYHVTTRDAHAWPEVYFADYGWITFEPTPTIGDDSPGNPSGTAGAGASSGTTSTTRPTPISTTPTTAGAGATPPTKRRANEHPVPRLTTSRPAAHHTVRVLFTIVAVLLVVLLAPIAIVRWLRWRRRRGRRHAGSSRDQVTGAWTHVNERLAHLGVQRRASSTPVEFALREAPAAGVGAAGPALLELARLHTEAMYARDEPEPETAAAAWEHVDVIDHALRDVVRRRRNRWWIRLRW